MAVPARVPGKSRVKVATGPASAAPAGATRLRVHVPTLATLSSDLRTLFINICILGAFIILIPVVGAQFIRTQVIIEPISVPAALITRGLTSDVAANRLWDGLQAAQIAAATSKAGISAIPNSQRVDFSIPDSGISIDSLVYYVRQFFHAYQTRISGEFRCTDATCAPGGTSLRVRVLSDHLQIIELPPIGTTSEDDYFRTAAIEALKVLDPFTASAAEAEANPAAGMALAERLVLQHHPDAKWADNLIGTLKRNAGDTPGAVAEFRAALALDPDFMVAKTNLGATLTEAGDFAGATEVFDEIAKVAPTDKFLAIGRSKLAEAQGKPDDAVKYLLDAEAGDPGTSRYLFMASLVEYKAGQSDKAVALATRALDVDPAATGPLSLLAATYLSSGTPDKAEALYRRAAAYTPDDPALQGELAGILLQTHKFAEALTRAERAIAMAPLEASYQIARARALNSLGRYQDAVAQLDQVKKLDPANADLDMEYGDDFAALGRRDDARAAYNRVIAAAPDTGGAKIAALEIKLLDRSAAPTPAITAAAP